jgi:hypothetical protein
LLAQQSCEYGFFHITQLSVMFKNCVGDLVPQLVLNSINQLLLPILVSNQKHFWPFTLSKLLNFEEIL